MKRKVSPGLRASLDASNTWRASLPCGRGKIDKMSLIPNSPSPFVRGLVSYSGRGNHVNSARHAQDYPVAQHTLRAKQLLNTTRAGLVRCFTWERVSRARQNLPPRKKAKKKTPATLKSMTGAVGLTQEQCDLLKQCRSIRSARLRKIFNPCNDLVSQCRDLRFLSINSVSGTTLDLTLDTVSFTI